MISVSPFAATVDWQSILNTLGRNHNGTTEDTAAVRAALLGDLPEYCAEAGVQLTAEGLVFLKPAE
jgi:hypothetical protein